MEETIFEDKAATITTSRVVLSGTTYPITSITSVRQGQEPRGIVGGIVGVVALTIGAVLLIGVTDALCFVALPLMGIAVVWFAVVKPKPCVCLGVGGVEKHVAGSSDAEWVKRVIDAINTAIVRRCA